MKTLTLNVMYFDAFNNKDFIDAVRTSLDYKKLNLFQKVIVLGGIAIVEKENGPVERNHFCTVKIEYKNVPCSRAYARITY